jgi:hypothetical protein
MANLAAVRSAEPSMRTGSRSASIARGAPETSTRLRASVCGSSTIGSGATPAIRAQAQRCAGWEPTNGGSMWIRGRRPSCGCGGATGQASSRRTR